MITKSTLVLAVTALSLMHAAAAAAPSASTMGDGYRSETGPAFDSKLTLTREQVRAELRQAQADARMPVDGDAGAQAQFADFRSTLSRAQVHAEAIEASRLGLLDGPNEGEPRIATPAEAESIRQAGQRAVGRATLAQAQ